MKKSRRKTDFIAVVIALVCAVCTAMFFSPISYAYWGGFGRPQAEIYFYFTIGDWRDNESNVNFDSVYLNLVGADSLLSMDGSTGNKAHILGIYGEGTPAVPQNIRIYDVLMWEQDGYVVTFQVVANYPPDIFDSWQDLKTATETHVAFNDGKTLFSSNNLYTTAHASVRSGGKRWLARHNDIFETPQIGEDWFLVSDSWVAQEYPEGTFVEHEGRHYISYAVTQSEPGTSSDWYEVEEYSDRKVDYKWIADAVYANGDIVVYAQKYYISVIDANTERPDSGVGWEEILPYDPTDTVPSYNSNLANEYQVGDFVRVDSGEAQGYYLKTGNYFGTPNSGNGAWTFINNYEKFNSVSKWLDNIVYDNSYPDVLVESDGMIFQHISSWSAIGVKPNEDTNNWRRVKSWAETQRPAMYSPLDYPVSSIFEYEGAFYGVAIQPWSGMPFDTSGNYFREISAWSEHTTYRVLTAGDAWNNPPNNGQEYFAYTQDDGGEYEFWMLKQGFGGNTVSGADFAPHDDSPYWERKVFVCRENLVCTFVGGQWLVWDRVTPYVDGAVVSAPTKLNSAEWTRRTVACSADYVYTDDEDVTLLWRKTVAGDTFQVPGSGDWELVLYKTGKPYVYVYNPISGHPDFWHSQDELFTRPSSFASGWTLLLEELEDADEPPMYVYTNRDGIIRYFSTRFHPYYRGEFEFENGWIGVEGGKMIYEWKEHNFYKNGDMVVCDVTLTNTLRYYRLRQDIDAADAVGCRPGTPAGSFYWEAVNVLW